MCFFDQHWFACGHLKWGHFRQHCAKEYRIGETCGMKLIMQTIATGSKCGLCEEIDTNIRRRAAEVDRVEQWQLEPRKFAASIGRSLDLIRGLDGEIHELSRERNRRLKQNCHGQHGSGSTIGLETEETSSQDPETSVRLHESVVSSKSQEQRVGIEEFELIEKKNVFSGLLITFESANGPATVLAVPDSGSDHNVISFDLALHLGLKMTSDIQGRQLCLIDGGTVTSSGSAEAFCRFGMTFYTEPRNFYCVFRVLRSVISSLIMSTHFLESTETMTKYRQRFVIRSFWPPLPRICALGRTRSRLYCTIDGENVEALADSGSDVDVMSLDYVLRRGWKMGITGQEVVLADGRKKSACGICVVQLSVGKDAKMFPVVSTDQVNDESWKPPSDGKRPDVHTEEQPESTLPFSKPMHVRQVMKSTFYVLAGISVDALIGAASIESLKVFSHHTDALFLNKRTVVETPELHRISLAKRARHCASRLINPSITPSGYENRDRRSLEEQLNEADQRENARREAASAKSATLSGLERITHDAEEESLRRGYDEYRAPPVVVAFVYLRHCPFHISNL